MKIKNLLYQLVDDGWVFVKIEQQILFCIKPMYSWNNIILYYYIQFLSVVPTEFDTKIKFKPQINEFETIEEAKLECSKIVEKFIDFFIEK
jgi:hypothetical protein